MSTKDKILHYMKYQGWVSGSQLEDMAHEWRTKASTISRRCRELSESGELDRWIKGKTVQYRVHQEELSADTANKYLQTLNKLEKENQGALL